MIHFTKYANDKFDILNAHQVYFRKEEIEEIIAAPEKTSRRGKYYAARKDGIKVIYQKEGEVIKIITFFPVKNT